MDCKGITPERARLCFALREPFLFPDGVGHGRHGVTILGKLGYGFVCGMSSHPGEGWLGYWVWSYGVGLDMDFSSYHSRMVLTVAWLDIHWGASTPVPVVGNEPGVGLMPSGLEPQGLRTVRQPHPEREAERVEGGPAWLLWVR